MNKKTIIRLAHEAQFEGFGNGDWVCTTEEIEAFAALVAAERDKYWQAHIEPQIEIEVKEEREACAKVVEQTKWSNWFAADCIAAIRARNNHA